MSKSAPWEVWVFKYVDGSFSIDDEKRTGHKRYIRADLVCGECGNKECPHELFSEEDRETFRALPACMAFVSKEKSR